MLPTDPTFLHNIISAVNEHNTTQVNARLHIYPCLTLRPLAAAVTIQSAWRAHKHRRTACILQRVLCRRAAVCLQRGWRTRLWLSHLRMLEVAAMLVDSFAAMTLAPTLCLTLLAARLVGLTQHRVYPCLPGHRLMFAFCKESSGNPIQHKFMSAATPPSQIADHHELVPICYRNSTTTWI